MTGLGQLRKIIDTGIGNQRDLNMIFNAFTQVSEGHGRTIKEQDLE